MMAFAPVFQRPFSATFDRRAAAAGNGLLNALIAYWPLNEAGGANNALDLHTNGLAFAHTASPGSAAGKVYAGVRTFDTTQFFSRADDAMLSPTADFTIAAWVYYSGTLSDGTYRAILSSWDALTATFFLGKNPTGYPAFNTSADGDWISSPFLVHSTAFTINAWTLVVASYNATTNTNSISLNAAIPEEANGDGGIFDGSAIWKIGSYGSSGVSTRNWNGRIGPVAFWKSAAGGGGVLSSSQRSALWNAGNGLAYANFTT